MSDPDFANSTVTLHQCGTRAGIVTGGWRDVRGRQQGRPCI